MAWLVSVAVVTGLNEHKMNINEDKFNDACDDAIRRGDTESAFQLCQVFIDAHPSSPHGFRKRAYLWARINEFHRAVEDIGRAIQIRSNEPTYYFFRGWWQLELGDFAAAEADQSDAIRISEEQGTSSVDESAFFFRAFARLRLGKFQKALSDAEHVRDNFLIDLKSSGMITKAQIVIEAKQNS